MEDSPRIAVVGSLNWDVGVRVHRLPTPGETVLAVARFEGPGGKGANQAVAAARLGGSVAMVGRVGDDTPGDHLRTALATAGVDVQHVEVDGGAPTGRALITVDEGGENTIVVDPGANGRVDDADGTAPPVREAAVVMLQLEIPMTAVVAAARAARGLVILNPAPVADFDPDLIDEVDILVPNRAELARLAGREVPATIDEVTDLVRSLPGSGPTIVTLGSQGALVVDGELSHHFAAPTVHAVDATAAGDAFCGALAEALARGVDLGIAVERAVLAGAAATLREGAQASLPTPADVELLARHRPG